MRWGVVVVLALCASGCGLHDNLVECDGYLCSTGQVCDSVHHICIAPEQTTACGADPAGTVCSAGAIVGTCLDGVCLAQFCGDKIVEGTEVCDDGNRTSGDGCNDTCTSGERCGDGVVDETVGEGCDDGNLISGDGCDSRCGAEHEEWTVEGIAPTDLTQRGFATYDRIHHQLLHVAEGITWSWTGTRWVVLSTSELPHVDTWLWYQVMFDPDEGGALLVGDAREVSPQNGALNANQVWHWDGAHWIQHPVVGAAPQLIRGEAAYDSQLHKVFVLGEINNARVAYTLDVPTGVWTMIPSPSDAYQWSIAFDEARKKVVAIEAPVGGTQTLTYEWNGTGWTSHAAAPAGYGMGLVFDPALNALISVGGATTQDVPTIAKWTGTTWQTLSVQLPGALSVPGVAFDTDRNRLVVIGGVHSGALEQVLEWDGTQWTPPLFGAPPAENYGAAYAYDDHEDRLVVARVASVSTSIETWYRDAASTWHQGDAFPLDVSAPYFGDLAFDPIRQHVIGVSVTGSTSQLVGDHWEQIRPGDQSNNAYVMTFDPSRRAIVAVTYDQTVELPSGGSTWIPLVTGTFLPTAGSLAADARTSGLVLSDEQNGRSYQFVNNAWSASLSPGGSYPAVADPRRATVLLVGPASTMWERLDGSWSERPGPPLPVSKAAVYNARRGELIVIGKLNTSRLIQRRRLVSATPLETCEPAVDADGDGVAGCDDPDCWWACGTCPPYATCP